MVDAELALRLARPVQAVAEASHGLSERFSRAHALGMADVRGLMVLAMADEPITAVTRCACAIRTTADACW